MIKIAGHVDDPESTIESFLARVARETETGLALGWDLKTYWKKPQETIRLAAILLDHSGKLECIISDQYSQLLESAELINDYQGFINLAEKSGMSRLNISQPMTLEPLYVPKPWGQEIWYTGIEERGVCCVEHNIPLPWMLSMAPKLTTGLMSGQPYEDPVLLKILDPHATAVYGDLYFEMHDKKKEVYIVTHIDEEAWPEGRGAIRFGFNENKVRSYPSSADFLSAYGEAVASYRQIRNIIDNSLDEIRAEQGINGNQVTNPEIVLSWLSSLPVDLIEKEQQLRESMENFTHLRKLDKGDIIQVPALTPHALQHGVRVVEFQTPHYERYIISFAQKVLTQDHWDTEKALALVNLERPAEKVDLISDVEGCRIEQIISFDQFIVYRINLEKGASYAANFKTYCLIIGLSGRLKAGHQVLIEEQALYLTKMALPVSVVNIEATTSGFLLAIPNLA